jgi:ubiquinone/menaquinone biosynthesis C-methylase UbiE
VNSDKVRRKYDRIARVYDALESPMEGLSFAGLRRDLLSRVRGRVLEVGVGTGKNLPYYPPGVDLTGIDVSPRMLERAEAKARALGIRPVLRVMDVERMDFPGGTFDTSVSTFVFCSVLHPREGLGEIRRVLKRGGRALFLEHVRSANSLAGTVMDLLNPLISALLGPHINRQTVELIRDAGFEILSDENGGAGIIRKVTALNP